jgi:long-chain fatty acid transport protein
VRQNNKGLRKKNYGSSTHHLFTWIGVCVCLAVLPCIFLKPDAMAAGLWLYEGSIPDMGMANAGRAASALDASTAGGNPAAMTVLERNQLVTGLLGILPKADFDVDQASYGGGGGGDAGYFTPGATLAYVHRVNDRLRLGLMVGSYFGLGLNYGDHWAGRYYIQDGQFLTAGINPSIGYRVTDWLSIGGGITMEVAKLYNKVAVNTLLPGRSDGRLKYEDTDLGYGYNLGILVELSKKTRFGLTYRSEVDLKFKDNPDLDGEGWLLDGLLGLRNQAGRTLGIDMTIPQAVMFSAYHQLNDRFVLCTNVGWQDWSEFGKPEISISGNRNRSFTSDLNYHDTYHVALGGRYRLAPKWLMSAGVAYDTSPIKHSGDRSPMLPLDRQLRYALGLQYDLNENITVGCAYEFLDAGLGRVDKNGGLFRGDLKGKYDTNYINLLNMNIVWKF